MCQEGKNGPVWDSRTSLFLVGHISARTPKKANFLHTVVLFLLGFKEEEVCTCKFWATQVPTAYMFSLQLCYLMQPCLVWSNQNSMLRAAWLCYAWLFLTNISVRNTLIWTQPNPAFSQWIPLTGRKDSKSSTTIPPLQKSMILVHQQVYKMI